MIEDINQEIPCAHCGEPTAMLGTRLCDNCWEIDRRSDEPLDEIEPEPRPEPRRFRFVGALYRGLLDLGVPVRHVETLRALVFWSIVALIVAAFWRHYP